MPIFLGISPWQLLDKDFLVLSKFTLRNRERQTFRCLDILRKGSKLGDENVKCALQVLFDDKKHRYYSKIWTSACFRFVSKAIWKLHSHCFFMEQIWKRLRGTDGPHYTWQLIMATLKFVDYCWIVEQIWKRLTRRIGPHYYWQLDMATLKFVYYCWIVEPIWKPLTVYGETHGPGKSWR